MLVAMATAPGKLPSMRPIRVNHARTQIVVALSKIWADPRQTYKDCTENREWKTCIYVATMVPLVVCCVLLAITMLVATYKMFPALAGPVRRPPARCRDEDDDELEPDDESSLNMRKVHRKTAEIIAAKKMANAAKEKALALHAIATELDPSSDPCFEGGRGRALKKKALAQLAALEPRFAKEAEIGYLAEAAESKAAAAQAAGAKGKLPAQKKGKRKAE